MKKSRLTILLMPLIILFLNNAFAQSIIFSSDQWPKRWERAMHHQPMNGYVNYDTVRRVQYKKVNKNFNMSRQSWGQQPETKRYVRSRTPEYNYHLYNNRRFPLMPLRRQYPVYMTPAYSGLPQSYLPTMGGVTTPSIPPILMGQGFYSTIGYPNSTYPNLLLPGLNIPVSGYPTLGYPWQ